jgi:NUMOD3 motif/GIY-YIG catalytic domain
MNKKHIIYGLLDPLTKCLHYIGYSSYLRQRMYKHNVNGYGTKEKRIWIARLKKQGLLPIVEIIKEYDTAAELPDAEDYWYSFFISNGAELYNDPFCIGIRNRTGKIQTEETKNKISQALMGHKTSEETKQNISNTKKGKTIFSEETRQKMSIVKKGKTWKVIDGKRVWMERI